MYAVIKTGGKQYKVAPGDVLEVEHLSAKDKKASFVPLLVVTDDGKTVLGAKELKAFSVAAAIVGETKGDKVSVFKYRPKSGYSAKTGHRQKYSKIEITSIGDKAPPAKSKEAPAAKPASSDAPPA